MSEQRRWTIHACEEHGHQDCAVSHGALDVIEVVRLSDLEAAEQRATEAEERLAYRREKGIEAWGEQNELVAGLRAQVEAAERRVEDMLDLLQWVYSETTDRNIRDRLRSALSTTEEPARGT